MSRDKQRKNATDRAYKRRHPEKERARNRLRNALKAGLVTKPAECEECGKEAHLDGHHEDYGDPLSVEWLCRTCHAKRHNGYKVTK